MYEDPLRLPDRPRTAVIAKGPPSPSPEEQEEERAFMAFIAASAAAASAAARNGDGDGNAPAASRPADCPPRSAFAEQEWDEADMALGMWTYLRCWGDMQEVMQEQGPSE